MGKAVEDFDKAWQERDVEAFLKAGAAAGAWTAEYPRVLAVMLFNAVHGACDEVILSPELIDREALIALLQQVFWRVVTPSSN